MEKEWLVKIFGYPKRSVSISHFRQCPKTTSVDIEVMKPSSGRRNNDRGKGGSWVMSLQSWKVHAGMRSCEGLFILKIRVAR